MKRIIHWFRNDLRITDHQILSNRLKEAEIFLPIYLFNPRQFYQTKFGFPKTGSLRTKFLIESVFNLQKELQALVGNLYVAFDYPERVISNLSKQIAAEPVFAQKEHTAEENQDE